jgi:hypothetical protein
MKNQIKFFFSITSDRHVLSNHCSIPSSPHFHFPPSPLSCYSPESVVTCRACYLSFMCFVPEFDLDLLVFAELKC